jgi:hypothetical protein
MHAPVLIRINISDHLPRRSAGTTGLWMMVSDRGATIRPHHRGRTFSASRPNTVPAATCVSYGTPASRVSGFCS